MKVQQQSGQDDRLVAPQKTSKDALQAKQRTKKRERRTLDFDPPEKRVKQGERQNVVSAWEGQNSLRLWKKIFRLR